MEKIAIQTKGLLGSDQSTVGRRMAMAMRTPPMVGVPDFFWWDSARLRGCTGRSGIREASE